MKSLVINQVVAFIGNLKDLSRWQEWYDSKIPLLFSCFYYLYLNGSYSDAEAIPKFAVVTSFGCVYLAFGYYINDISDLECDRQAGKQKLIDRMPWSVVIGLLVLLGFVGSTILLSQLDQHPLAVIFGGIAYFFAIFYSMPPIRLKERGVWGLIAAATAQRSILALFVFAIFDHFGLDTWLFFLLYSLIGIRWILVHQLLDLKRDLKSSVRTFTTEQGYERTRKLLYWVVFPLEMVSLVSLWAWLIARIPFAWILLLGYLVIMVGNWAIRRSVHISYDLGSYSQSPLSGFYYAYWPLALAIFLALQHPVFWSIWAFNTAWQASYILRELRFGIRLLLVKSGKIENRYTH
jgi:4-hydroxybenzoate polyprenyltransferase